MRVRFGFGWLGCCLALAVACGGNSLGSGLDTTSSDETPGADAGAPGSDALPGAAGAGASPSSGGAPSLGAAGEANGGETTGGTGEGAAPTAGGAPPGMNPTRGGAPVGPPTIGGAGGMLPIGGEPGVAGFGAFGGMVVERRVSVPRAEIPPLDECTYREDCFDTLCSCNYQCPGVSIYASCYEDTEREPDGTWTCQSLESDNQTFRVGGLELPDACRLAADLSGGDPEYVEAERCVPERRERSERSCHYSDVCTGTIALGDGRVATLGRIRSIGCTDLDGICLIDDLVYRADDIDLADRCEALLPYAEEPPQASFEEPPECETTIFEDVEGGCQTQPVCVFRAEVGPSVEREHMVLGGVACESDGLGGSRCACFDGVQTLRFDTAWPTSGAAACEVARSACEGGLEFTGPVECRPRYVSVDSTFCDSMADCTRPATLAGEDVVAIGALHASCIEDGETYACDCVSGEQGRRVAVEASSAFQACVQARDACREVIEVRFVGENGSVGAPSP